MIICRAGGVPGSAVSPLSFLPMSLVSDTRTGIRKAYDGAGVLFRSRAFQGVSAALLVAALLSPLFVPFVHLAAYALLAAGSVAVLGYPAARLAADGLRRLAGISLSSGPSGSGSVKASERDRLRNVSDGKATGNALADALADRLRKSGLKVSTDWKEASAVLKRLPERYDRLRKDGDSLRGFVYQGVIFLNPARAEADVPVHEYTHVWAEALRQKNPEEWRHIVGLLKKETALWEEVRAGYPHLTTEDEVADEVLATYSGRYGRDMLGRYYDGSDKPRKAFDDLRRALELFWKEVSKFFKCHFDTVENVADRVLYDLLSGVNPDRYIDENKVTLSDRGPLAARGFRKPSGGAPDASQDSDRVPLKDRAVARFSELLISRMEEMEKSHWKKGWVSGSSVAGLPQNIRSGVLNGINRFILQIHTAENGYSMPLYMTRKQANDFGVSVNKGEESIPVIYWNLSYKDENGRPVSQEDYDMMSDAEKEHVMVVPFLKGYYEFNIDQTNFREVAPEKYQELQARFRRPEVRDDSGMYANAALDRMLERQEWLCPVRYREPSPSAYFSHVGDRIVLPMKSQFKVSDTPEEIYKDGMEFYSTAIHEMGHSTGTPGRLNRPMEGRFGDKDYGYEECIVEMAAAVVGKTLGFDKRIYANNTNYVRGWIQNIRQKPSVVLTMLGDIGKASNLILAKVNEQMIALGEKPILGKDSILSEDDEQEVRRRSTARNIVRFIVGVASDPTPYAAFSAKQAYVIRKYLSEFGDSAAMRQEADRLWSLAEKDPGMKGLPDEWKASARSSLNDVVEDRISEGYVQGVKM